MKLSGSQVEQFQKALLDAFIDRPSLEQMVRVGLEENLSEIAGVGRLTETTFALIRWAEAQDRLGDLLDAARKANPRNGELQRFTLQPAPTGTEVVTAPAHNGTGKAASRASSNKPPSAKVFGAWSAVAISWGIAWVAFQAMPPPRHLPVYLLVWAIVGLATGMALQWVESRIRWPHIVALACGWLICGLALSLLIEAYSPQLGFVPFTITAFYYTVAAITFGGLVVGLVMHMAVQTFSWPDIASVALTWGVAFYVLCKLSIPWDPIAQFVAGALLGAIGGGVTLWRLRHVRSLELLIV